VHLGGQNFKLPIVFKSARKNNINIKRKRELSSILDFGVTLKQIKYVPIHDIFTGLY